MLAITLKGIEEAVQSLGYKHEGALKYRLVTAIRSLYVGEMESLQSVKGIPSEELIGLLWGVEEDAQFMRSKKKNLSSIKSSVNADFKRLYREGKNPEGVIIGTENLFTMSEEARDDLLATFHAGAGGVGAGALSEINEVLSRLNGILSGNGLAGESHSPETSVDLEQIKSVLKDLSEKVGLSVFDQDSMQRGPEQGKPEAITSVKSVEAPEAELHPKEDEITEQLVETNDLSGEVPATDDELIEDMEAMIIDQTELTLNPESVDLTSMSEGEWHETLEEIDENEDVIVDSEEEDAPALEEEEPGGIESESLYFESALESAADEIEGELAEAEEEEAEEYDDSEDVIVDSEEEEAPALEVEGEGGIEAESLDLEPALESAVDEVDLEGDLAEVEEEEPEEAEEYDTSEDVIVDSGEEEFPALEEGEEGIEAESLDLEPALESAVDEVDLEGDLAEVEEEEPEEAEEYDTSEDVIVDSGEEEFPALEEGEEGIEAESLDLEPALESAVDEVDLEGDLAEVEEEEAEEAEEYDTSEDVIVDSGEEEVPALEVEGEEGIEGESLDLEPALESAVDEVALEGDLAEADEEEAEEYENGEHVDDDQSLGEGGVSQETADAPSQDSLMNDPSSERGSGEAEAGEYGEIKQDAKILSETFNASLSEMGRFYNRYLLIPAGQYTIGSEKDRTGQNRARRVRLPEFYMGKFPVTNGLFDIFVEKTGYRTVAERVGYGTVYYGRFQRKKDEKTGRERITWNSSMRRKIVPGAFWYQPRGPGSNLHNKTNHPVVQVSIEDAMAFAAWTGKRLPTEEEWEAASRTMKGYLYPWGHRFREDACNVEKNGYGDTTPVDLYLKFENEYGIADLLGNVLEWTTGSSFLLKKDRHDRIGFIAKGGSAITAKPMDLTSRAELGREFHSNILGFRCVAY